MKEKIKAYEQSHDITMIEKFGAHYYTRHDMGPFPSVTTILGMVGGAGGLIPWAVKQSMAEIRQVLTTEYLYGTNKDAISLSCEELDGVLEAARGAADRARDEAAEFGTHVHNAIERLVKTSSMPEIELTDAEQKQYQVAVDHIEDHKLELVAAELPIFSRPDITNRTPGYAGTIDMVACDADGGIHLLDWKTGNHKSKTHAYQLAAYAVALQRELSCPVESATVVYTKLDKTTDVDIAANYDTFLKIADCWDAMHATVNLYEGAEI